MGVTDVVLGFAYINGRLDLHPAEGGVKSIKYQKEVAARPPNDPQKSA
jgi:hypothetical protein